jgi:prefoldin subunit 5
VFKEEPPPPPPKELTEKDYEEAVKRLKENYPKIGRRAYKTEKKTWKQLYEEMLDIIKKGKWVPQPKKPKAKK